MGTYVSYLTYVSVILSYILSCERRSSRTRSGDERMNTMQLAIISVVASVWLSANVHAAPSDHFTCISRPQVVSPPSEREPRTDFTLHPAVCPAGQVPQPIG